MYLLFFSTLWYYLICTLIIQNFLYYCTFIGYFLYEGEEPPGEGDAVGDQRNLPDFLPRGTHLLADQ